MVGICDSFVLCDMILKGFAIIYLFIALMGVAGW